MKKWLGRFAWISLLGLVLFVGMSFLRVNLVKNEIRLEGRALAASASPQIGETKSLEILPLYEAHAQDGLEHGHGVSYLVRTDSATILFDLGNNLTAASPSPLEKNMQKLGVSLDEIDLIVISHRHPDHVGGQNWWTEKTFSLDGLTQPALGDLPIYIPEAMSYPGSRLALAKLPVTLAEGVATTGQITYEQPFPIWLATPSGDEQALAVHVAGRGIVLITGCGHMGLDNLLERAQNVFTEPVVGVVGGLHYGNTRAAELQEEIQLMQSLNPVLVALSPHDSGAAALEAFSQAFPAAYRTISVGSTIRLSQPTNNK